MLPARYAAILSLPPFWQHWDRASLKDARQAPYHCSTARSVLVLKLLTEGGRQAEFRFHRIGNCLRARLVKSSTQEVHCVCPMDQACPIRHWVLKRPL